MDSTIFLLFYFVYWFGTFHRIDGLPQSPSNADFGTDNYACAYICNFVCLNTIFIFPMAYGTKLHNCCLPTRIKVCRKQMPHFSFKGIVYFISCIATKFRTFNILSNKFANYRKFTTPWYRFGIMWTESNAKKKKNNEKRKRKIETIRPNSQCITNRPINRSKLIRNSDASVAQQTLPFDF